MNRSFVHILLFALSMGILPLSVSAQKEVRKNIRKGNKAYQQQKFSEASPFYDNAVKANPSSKEATFNLGNTLYKQKEWDKSVEHFNHFISLEQENPTEAAAGWHNIGNAMLQKKDLQKSMEAYKMALRLNPQDNETRYNLAVVQKMIQDQQQDQQPDKGEGEQDQQQDQQQQNPQDQEQRAEQPDQPEQMSRDNARQMLQAIEQDEQQTQEKVQQIRAKEREQQAEENKRNNKNW